MSVKVREARARSVESGGGGGGWWWGWGWGGGADLAWGQEACLRSRQVGGISWGRGEGMGAPGVQGLGVCWGAQEWEEVSPEVRPWWEGARQEDLGLYLMDVGATEAVTRTDRRPDKRFL